jgi:hypothetical protein
VASPRKDLYLHRTAQQRKTKTNIYTLSGIRTHDISVQAIKAYASDCAASGTDNIIPPLTQKLGDQR